MLPYPEEKYLSLVQGIHQNIKKEEVQIFNGWNYVVFVVNDNYAFRFPRNQKWSKRLPAEVKFSQAFSSISPLPLPVQELHIDSEVGVYSAYRYISGIQLDLDLLTELSWEKQSLIAKKVGEFLTALHSFPVDKAKSTGVEVVNWVSFWSERLEGNKISAYPYMTEKERQWTDDLFHNFFQLISSETFLAVPIHFDMRLEHIIVDPNSYAVNGIIDISGDIADPAYDFIFFGEKLLTDVFKYYKGKIDNHFEERKEFYIKAQVIYDIESYSSLNDQKKVEEAIKRLKTYIG